MWMLNWGSISVYRTLRISIHRNDHVVGGCRADFGSEQTGLLEDTFISVGCHDDSGIQNAKNARQIEPLASG